MSRRPMIVSGAIGDELRFEYRLGEEWEFYGAALLETPHLTGAALGVAECLLTDLSVTVAGSASAQVMLGNGCGDAIEVSFVSSLFGKASVVGLPQTVASSKTSSASVALAADATEDVIFAKVAFAATPAETQRVAWTVHRVATP